MDVRLELTLIPGHEPVSGTFTGPGMADLPFVGWVELSGLIEQARAMPPQAPVAGGGKRDDEQGEQR